MLWSGLLLPRWRPRRGLLRPWSVQRLPCGGLVRGPRSAGTVWPSAQGVKQPASRRERVDPAVSGLVMCGRVDVRGRHYHVTGFGSLTALDIGDMMSQYLDSPDIGTSIGFNATRYRDTSDMSHRQSRYRVTGKIRYRDT